MNPTMRVEAHENRLCEETEEVYDEDFFTSLTAVVNALDNVAARTFAFVHYENTRPAEWGRLVSFSSLKMCR